MFCSNKLFCKKLEKNQIVFFFHLTTFVAYPCCFSAKKIEQCCFFSAEKIASASDTGFNPEECYSVVRKTHKRNSLQAVSRDYEVHSTDIEGNVHHLKKSSRAFSTN